VIYLDNAATTPARREVLEAMWPYLTGEFGNPSSHHELGERAARAVTLAREVIAEQLGCRPSELIFTSGGTEADNLAIKGIALAAPRGRRILTTATEHEAVLASCDYLRRFHDFEIVEVPLDGAGLGSDRRGSAGLVDVDAFSRLLSPDTTLVSIAHANNEIGTVQPIAELAALARAAGVPFHSDAVQSAGWLDVGLRRLGVDALSVAGHKLGAPKGIGVLALRAGVPLEPLLHGGGQERGRRSGTENVAAIVGLATAVRLAAETRNQAAAVEEVRDALIDGVLAAVPTARLTGSRRHRLANSASFVFPGTSGEAVLLELEARGIVCSSGSACAAGSDEPSHVLVAIGIAPELAQTAVRFTLGHETTRAEVDETVLRVRDAVAALRGHRVHGGLL